MLTRKYYDLGQSAQLKMGRMLSVQPQRVPAGRTKTMQTQAISSLASPVKPSATDSFSDDEFVAVKTSVMHSAAKSKEESPPSSKRNKVSLIPLIIIDQLSSRNRRGIIYFMKLERRLSVYFLQWQMSPSMIKS